MDPTLDWSHFFPSFISTFLLRIILSMFEEQLLKNTIHDGHEFKIVLAVYLHLGSEGLCPTKF